MNIIGKIEEAIENFLEKVERKLYITKTSYRISKLVKRGDHNIRVTWTTTVINQNQVGMIIEEIIPSTILTSETDYYVRVHSNKNSSIEYCTEGKSILKWLCYTDKAKIFREGVVRIDICKAMKDKSFESYRSETVMTWVLAGHPEYK